MKNYLLTAFIAFSVLGGIGCSPSQKQEDKINRSDKEKCEECNEHKSLAFYGTYRGTFPCADCSGKKIELTLADDGTYCLKYEYLDKGERLIEENGTFSILDESIVETVTPSSGEKTYYKFLHGNLVLSDSLGTISQGELAKLYVLKK